MNTTHSRLVLMPRATMPLHFDKASKKQPVRYSVPAPLITRREMSMHARQMRCSAQSDGSPINSTEAYSNLQGAKVWLVSRQEEIDVTSLLDESDRTFLVFARSFGCNFCQQLARELQSNVLPKLKDQNIKLYLIGMGPPDRGLEFSELTEFPADRLIADPENVTYDRLHLKKSGPFWTFFDPRTPFTLAKRAFNGGLGSTFHALSNWRPWIPKKQGQAFQQGGTFLFEGKEVVWQQYDQATGAHTEPSEILEVAGL